MIIVKLLAAALLSAGSIATAQDVVLLGRVQQVVLQPFGTENCPPPCSAVATVQPDGSQRVCISNAGGCQSMEVAVDTIYRGGGGERTRRFKSSIGEWGPSFPVTRKQIVVSEEGGSVFWSFATVREGRIYVDPKKLGSVGRFASSAASDNELVALDDMLARTGARR